MTIGDGKTGLHPVLFNLHEVLAEQIGASEVGWFTRDQYPGFGQGDEIAGLRVNPPMRPECNQSTYGLIIAVPVDPDPGPYLKIIAPVAVDLQFAPTAEQAARQRANVLTEVNQQNKTLLSAHLILKDYQTGSYIEAQAGLPAVGGQFDTGLFMRILGETVGMADMIDDRMVSAIGMGRTAR